MFQYVAGLQAEKRWGIPVAFDVLAPPRDRAKHPRPFMLDRFRITRPMHHGGLIWRRSFYGAKFMPVKHALHKLAGVCLLDEKTLHHFDSQLVSPPRGRRVLVRGYWQCKDYLDGVTEQVRSEFRFRDPPVGRNAEYLAAIERCNSSVSLHIRRGDYQHVANGSIILPLGYYREAIRRCSKNISDPHYFVFSDDLEWARDNLPAGIDATFVEGNAQDEAHEDLRLMAACKHHIIANSSFSWWGAWLNPFEAKIVIAPKYWMMKKDTLYSDLFPASWIQIDNLKESAE